MDDMAEAQPRTPEMPWEKSYPESVDWHATIDERPLFAILDDAVARFGDRPCVDFLGKRFSYREIGDLVARAA
ncbi:MAG: long-chain fatty acid--CoA ligase, partial [Alphaproteobacteria bacterium]